MASVTSRRGLRNAARTYIVRSPFVQYRVASACGAGAARARGRHKEGPANADKKAKRAVALHSRAPEGDRSSALLRRDEGRLIFALQVRDSPADHRARGTRFYPPPA